MSLLAIIWYLLFLRPVNDCPQSISTGNFNLLASQICLFDAIRENKILAKKISGLTVPFSYVLVQTIYFGTRMYI